MFNNVGKVLCFLCCFCTNLVSTYPARNADKNSKDSDYQRYHNGRFPLPKNPIQSFPSSKNPHEDPYSLKKSSSNQIPNPFNNNLYVNDIKKENKEFDGLLWERQSYQVPQIYMKENIIENFNFSQDNISVLQPQGDADSTLVNQSSDASPLLKGEGTFSNQSFTLPTEKYPVILTTEKNPDPVLGRYNLINNNSKHFAGKKRDSIDPNFYPFGYADGLNSRQNFRRDQNIKRKALNGFSKRNFNVPQYSNFDYGEETDDTLFNDMGDMNPNLDSALKRVSSQSKDGYDKSKFLNNFPSSFSRGKLPRLYRNDGYLMPVRKSVPLSFAYSEESAPPVYSQNVGFSVRTKQTLPDITRRNDGNFKSKPFYDNSIRFNGVNSKPSLKGGIQNTSNQNEMNGNVKNKPYYADNPFFNGVNRKPGYTADFYKDGNYPQNIPIDYDAASKNLDLFPPENGFDFKPSFVNSYNNPFFANKVPTYDRNMKNYGISGNGMQNTGYQKEKQVFKNKPGFNMNSYPQNMPLDYDFAPKNLAIEPYFPNMYNNPYFGSRQASVERNLKRSEAALNNMQNTNVQKEVFDIKETEVNDLASKTPIDTIMVQGSATNYSEISTLPKTNFSGLIQTLSGSIEGLINDTKNMFDSSPSKQNEEMINCQNDLCRVETPNNETKVYKNESISFLIRTSKGAEGNESEFSLTKVESVPEGLATRPNESKTTGNTTVEEMKETLKFKFDIKTENAKHDDQEESNGLGNWQRLNSPSQDFSGQTGPPYRYPPLMYGKPISNDYKNPENSDYGDYGINYRSFENPRHSIVKKHLGNGQMYSPENFQKDPYRDDRVESMKESDDSSEIKKQRKESRISKKKSSAIEKKMSSNMKDIKTKKTFINMKKPPEKNVDVPEKKVDVPENVNKIVYEKIEYIGKSKLNDDDDNQVLKPPVKKTKVMPNYEMNTDENPLRKTSNFGPSLETSYSSPVDREIDPVQVSSRDEEAIVDPSGSDYLGYYGNKNPEFESNGMEPKSSIYQDDTQRYPKDESVYDSNDLKKDDKGDFLDADSAAYEDDPYYIEAEKNVEDEVRNRLLSDRSRATDYKKSNSDYDENLGGIDVNAMEGNAEGYDGDIGGERNKLDENSLDDSEMGNSLEDDGQLDDYQTSKVSQDAGVMNSNSLADQNFDQMLSSNKGGVHAIPKPDSDNKNDKSFGTPKNIHISENQDSGFPVESLPMNDGKEFQKVEKFQKNTNRVLKNRKNMYNQTSRLKNQRKPDKQLLKEAYFYEKEESKLPSTDDNDNNKNSKNQVNIKLKSSQKLDDKKFKQTVIAPMTDMTSQSLEPPRNPMSESKFNSPKASSFKGPVKSKVQKNRLQDYDYDDEDIEYDDDDEEYDNEEEDYGAITKFGKGKLEKDRKTKSKLISKTKEKVLQPYKKNSDDVPPYRKNELLIKRSQSSNPDSRYNIKLDIQEQNKRDNDKTIRSFDPYPKNEIENPKSQDVKENDVESESLPESKSGPTENLYKTSSFNETRKLEESKIEEQGDKLDQNPSYGFQENSEVGKEDSKEVPNFKKSSFQDDRWSLSKQKQFQANKRKGNQLNKGAEVPYGAKGRNMYAVKKDMLKKVEYKLSLAEKELQDDNRKLSSQNNAKFIDSSAKKIPQKTETLEGTESFGKNANEETSDVNENYQRNFQTNYKPESRISPYKKFPPQKLFREDSSVPKNNMENMEESPNLSSAQNSELPEDPDEREVLELGLQLLNREKELEEVDQETMSQNINGNEQDQNSYLGQSGKQFPIVAPFRNIPRYKKSSSKLDELLGKEINSLRSNKLRGVNANKKTASKDIKYEKQIKESKSSVEEETEDKDDKIFDTEEGVDEFEGDFNTTNSWIIMNEEETIDDDKEKTKVKESKIFKEIHKSKGKPSKPKPKNPLTSVEQDKFSQKKHQSETKTSEEGEEISFDSPKNEPTLGVQKLFLKRRGEDTPKKGVKKPDARKRQLFRKTKRSDNSLNTFEKSLSDSVMEPQVKFPEKRPATESNVLDAESGNIYYMTIGTTTQDERVDDFVHFKQ